MAGIDTILIFLTQNICNIDGLLIYFIIGSKVVNDINVIP